MYIRNFTFQGHVKVYLQGLNALEAINTTPDCQSYYLGSSHTGIKIRDYRRLPREAAKQALDGNEVYQCQFAQIFNQPGHARIHSLDGNVEIDIHEDELMEQAPTLWMGVVPDGASLSLAYVDWEILKAVGDNKTGFAALVRE